MSPAITRSLGFLALAMLIGAPFAVLYAWFSAAGSTLGSTLAAVGYMFSPLAASVVFARRAGVGLRDGLGLRPRRTWAWLGAWGLPLGAVVLTTGLGFLVPGASYSPDMSGMFDRYADALTPEQLEQMRAQIAAVPFPPPVLFTLALIQASIAGSTINAAAAFGEEAGWRGWLHHELRPLGFWKSSLWIGALWGLWHAPLILQGHNYPEHPVMGVFGMVVFCMLLAPGLTWVRDRTGSSLGAAVFHGVVNGAAGLPMIFLAGGSDLTVGMTGAAGLVALLVVDGGLALAGVGRGP